MNLVLLCRGALESLPPVLSTALGLARLGVRVRLLVSTVTPPTVALLAAQGIDVLQLQPSHSPRQHLLGKLLDWEIFRKRAWKVLESMGPEVLWVGSADTALALGRRLLQQRYVLQLHELYDQYPLYRYGLRRYARQARCVVVPQASRASIFRYWFGLAETPVVLPNKPFEHPHDRNLPIRNASAQSAIHALEGKKLLLFQGHIGRGRDLTPLAEAVRAMSPEYHLLLMGLDPHGWVARLTRVCPRTSHIPYIAPPEHLTVTSHAHIGLVSYDHDSLNSLFCAPNKIWEYAGFGLPILAANLPGLQSTVGAAGAGICTDWGSPSRILKDLSRIEEHYAQFSTGARAFYASIDTLTILEHILWRLGPSDLGNLAGSAVSD